MNSLYPKPFMTQVRPAKTPKKKSAPSKSRQAAPVAQPASSPSPRTPSVVVRRSGVHGKGVYANRDFKRGEVIIEYKGEIITWDEALRRHPHDPSDPNHTFYFHLDDGHVIDGKHHGNAAKWINHACAPNCQADQEGDQVFIKARRAIKAGTELFYDYGLVIDEPITAKLKKEYRCLCGSPKCRGTLLAGRM